MKALKPIIARTAAQRWIYKGDIMNNQNNNGNAVTGGVGFIGLLQLAFIILKLCKVITWSWWKVFLPAIIGAGLFAVAILAIIFAIILYAIANHKNI